MVYLRVGLKAFPVFTFTVSETAAAEKENISMQTVVGTGVRRVSSPIKTLASGCLKIGYASLTLQLSLPAEPETNPQTNVFLSDLADDDSGYVY